jgi:HK97 gp10 family phage protein
MAFRATSTFTINDANIKGLLAKVGQGTFDGVTAASELIRDEAKTLCPVDTGALQASITADVQRGIRNITDNPDAPLSGSAFGVTGVVAPHEDYAAYVEFGTGQRGAASAGAGEGPYNPDWPGMVAQPYMRPAWDANKATAEDLVKQAVQDALK